MTEATREKDAAEIAFEAAAKALAEAGFETSIGDDAVDGDPNRHRFMILLRLSPGDDEVSSAFAIQVLYEAATAVHRTGCVDVRLGAHNHDGDRTLVLQAIVAKVLS